MLSPALQPLAARLPSLSPAEAAWCRRLFDGRLAFQLAQWLPGLVLRRADTANLPWPAGIDLVWRAPGVQVVMGVPPEADAMVGVLMHAERWSQADRMVCVLTLLRESLAPLHDGVHALGLRLADVQVRPMGVDAGPAPGPGLALELECHALRMPLRVVLDEPGAPPAWLARLDQQLAAQDGRVLKTLAPLAVPLRYAFGHRRLAVSALAQWEPGDVLLLPVLPAARRLPAGVPGLLMAGPAGSASLVRRARMGGLNVTVTGESWMVETPSAGELPAVTAVPGESAEGRTIAAIEVELHLELASIQLSLGALAAMRPGFVIELPTAPEDTQVSLMVGGQVFGRAQLVCIGDRMGAQLLELNHDAQPPLGL